uniref:Putative PD-(D/E)XK nuclease superfamily protein n=1 Tax=viral metagenome TaxID=1070528 RepID=A0A6M3LCG6_9ZZZZ
MADTKAHQRYRLKPTPKFPKGEIVPGVTTIIDSQLGWNKRVLMAWTRREALAGQDPEKLKEEAGDSGTCTHRLVEAHIKRVEADLKDFTANQINKAETGFLAFLDWEKENKLEYVGLEFQVVSESLRYGGTIDILARKNSSLWQVDLKTSKGIWPEMKVQVAAYNYAYEEQEGKHIDECHLLQLNKEDGSFQHHKLSREQIDDGLEVFLACRKLYDIQKRFK